MRLPAALLAALLLALVAAAGGRSSSTATGTGTASFAFGRTGGNILPFSVTIARNGHVTSHGAVKQANPNLTVSADVLRGLLRLAQAEGFFAMPQLIPCSRGLPDIASLFVTVKRSSGTKTVTVHGFCKARFNEVYDVLSAVAGVQT